MPRSTDTPQPESEAARHRRPEQVRRAPEKSAQRQPGGAPTSPLLNLQARVGNQAVLRMLAQRQVQAKLTVGPANDPYEREADRMADQVLRAPAPSANAAAPAEDQVARTPEDELQTKPLAAQVTPVAQREAMDEDELQRAAMDEDELQREAMDEDELQRAAMDEDELQREAMDEDELQREAMDEDELQREAMDEDELQRSAPAGGEGFEAGAEVESRLAARQGQGAPLPDNVRQRMEGGFGADFSGVRVHTDSEAGQLSRSIQAQAFTHGSDIYMGPGKYHPGSEGGQRLLAHELTHVVQQGAATPTKPGPEAGPLPLQRRKDNHQPRKLTTGAGRVQRIVDTEIAQLEPFLSNRRGARAPHIVELLKVYNAHMHAGRRPDQAEHNLLHEAYRLVTAMLSDRLNARDDKAAQERESLKAIANRLAQEINYLGQYREILQGKQLGKGQVNTVWKVLFADGWEAVWKKDSDKVDENVAGLAAAAGIPVIGANFGGRNIAMYKMDQLLGTGVIPRTERAVWGNNAGTVMEMVKGKQLANTEVDAQGAAGNTTGTDVDYADPDIQRGLSNLQMLDAICGQFDRHGGNIMVETTRGGGIRGIKGIDNDFAFGVKMKLNETGRVSHERGMPRFVDVHLAAIMTRITGDDVRQTLAGLLTRDEIEATVERFEQAKAYCVGLIRFHNNKLVMQWDQNTYDAQMREAREAVAKEGDEEKFEFARVKSGSYLYDRQRQLQRLKEAVARNVAKVRVETLV